MGVLRRILASSGSDPVGITKALAILFSLGIALTTPSAQADSPRKSGALLATSSARPPMPEPHHEFRMEGAPSLESAFGDARSLEADVHAFVATWKKMSALRREFADATHRMQRILHAPRRRGSRCPAGALLEDLERANAAIADFEALGLALEDHYLLLRRLGQLGDAQALTPSVQSAVTSSHAIYRRALEDFQEMRAVMNSEVRAGLARHRCSAKALRTRPALGKGDSQAPAAPKESRPTPPMTQILFVVDNRGCSSDAAVVLDGTAIGTVGGGAQLALRASRGSHKLCLGTECKSARSVFLHNGFRIARTCTARPSGQ